MPPSHPPTKQCSPSIHTPINPKQPHAARRPFSPWLPPMAYHQWPTLLTSHTDVDGHVYVHHRRRPPPAAVDARLRHRYEARCGLLHSVQCVVCGVPLCVLLTRPNNTNTCLSFLLPLLLPLLFPLLRPLHRYEARCAESPPLPPHRAPQPPTVAQKAE